MQYAKNLLIMIFFLNISTIGLVHASENDVTASHVYYITEQIKSDLKQILKSIGKTMPHLDVEYSNRLPRHALQKAREITLKLHRYQNLYNLEYEPLEFIPVQYVAPAQVKVLVDKINEEIKILQKQYAIHTYPDPVKFIEGKSLNDIYINLAIISTAIDEMIGASTAPHDVYRMIISVENDIKAIRKHIKINSPIEAIPYDANKTPTDVYNRVYDLLNLLHILSQKEGFKIPQGIYLPAKIPGRKVPAEVLDLLGQVKAEVIAIMFSIGLTQPSVIAPMQPGKTPPDVYQEVERSISLVKTLL